MQAESVVAWISAQSERVFDVVRSPDERLYVLYLATALLLGVGVYLERRPEGRSLRGLLGFLFPKDVYLHASAKTDYVYALVNRLLYPLLVLPFVASSVAAFALGKWLAPTSFEVTPGIGLDLAFTLLTVLTIDVSMFVTHYLSHRVPLLWEFHKVHHSAEVLTPVSVYRMHPVDDVMTMTCSVGLMGLVQGLWMATLPATGSLISVFQLNALLFVFYVAGYNLRHSHVWIDFGWASKLFVSPAMHQIHHSVDPRHYDKNFGFMFSIWDRIANTAVLPSGYEELRFGIDGEQEAEYQEGSPLRLYWLPFRKILARPKEALVMDRPARLLLILTLALGVGLAAAQVKFTRDSAQQPVALDDLTWTEVRGRIDAGWTRVIVPTGGTEQNGPHVVLGKHNRIVSYAAERVARLLGETLVAPVLAYVPEGEIDPPEGHMAFAGTISLDEETFERVLERTARSLIAHGFREVCFLGDSGGNQAAQARVAERLNRAFAERGVRVVHVGDYYAKNGQREWLEAQGETAESIGGHAGIRDTSELLFVDRSGVRTDKRKKDGGSDFARTGVSGDPTKASAAWGKKMIELKIEAALRQIKALPALEAGEPAPVGSASVAGSGSRE